MERAKKRKAGFTFTEALVVAVIACSLMIVIQALFSHTVRVTMKGQDNLDSIRAASLLFSSLRQDMLHFVSLSTGGAVATIDLGTEMIPDSATYSKILALKTRTEQITYSLVEDSGKNYVERVLQSVSKPSLQRKLFGVPRMKDFGVLFIRMPDTVSALARNTGRLLVKVSVDSEDARFPSCEIKLSSVFFSDRLSDCNWNYLDL